MAPFTFPFHFPSTFQLTLNVEGYDESEQVPGDILAWSWGMSQRVAPPPASLTVNLGDGATNNFVRLELLQTDHEVLETGKLVVRQRGQRGDDELSFVGLGIDNQGQIDP